MVAILEAIQCLSCEELKFFGDDKRNITILCTNYQRLGIIASLKENLVKFDLTGNGLETDRYKVTFIYKSNSAPLQHYPLTSDDIRGRLGGKDKDLVIVFRSAIDSFEDMFYILSGTVGCPLTIL